jgi:PhzF family phenazine biosynthesis protein
MHPPIYIVDAFADAAFSGNPAGVCILGTPATEDWMQSVAAEMKHAETAFLSASGEDPTFYDLRWFTPTCEVDLCGHATLASAHILYETRRLASDLAAQFRTKSGMLAASRRHDRIALDFPAEPVTTADPPIDFGAALGYQPVFIGRNRMDWLVELESEAAVRGLQPDLREIAIVEARGLIVTARGRDHDFVSRFFAPRAGVPEDHVTGSAHCALAPYWSSRLRRKEMTGYQASARGGIVGVEDRGDRVVLLGTAVTVLEGRLCV